MTKIVTQGQVPNDEYSHQGTVLDGKIFGVCPQMTKLANRNLSPHD